MWAHHTRRRRRRCRMHPKPVFMGAVCNRGKVSGEEGIGAPGRLRISFHLSLMRTGCSETSEMNRNLLRLWPQIATGLPQNGTRNVTFCHLFLGHPVMYFHRPAHFLHRLLLHAIGEEITTQLRERIRETFLRAGCAKMFSYSIAIFGSNSRKAARRRFCTESYYSIISCVREMQFPLNKKQAAGCSPCQNG